MTSKLSNESQLILNVMNYVDKNKLGGDFLNTEWNVEDHPELHQYIQKLVSIREERSEKRRNKMSQKKRKMRADKILRQMERRNQRKNVDNTKLWFVNDLLKQLHNNNKKRSA